MRRLIPIFLLLAGLMYAQPVQAQDDPPAAPAATATTDEATPDAKTEYLELTEGNVKVNDIVTDATKIYTAITDLQEAKKGAKKAAILLLLVAICKFLLSGVKLVKKHFWKSRKGKTVLRLSTLGLGLLVLILCKLAVGVGWMDALFYALAGPGALAAHELLGIFAGMKDDKDAPTPSSG